MRYAILTRRPACDTDMLSIYTQSGSLLATRHLPSSAVYQVTPATETSLPAKMRMI